MVPEIPSLSVFNREKFIFAFWWKGNTTPVGKSGNFLKKYTKKIFPFFFFWEVWPFIFCLRSNIIFLGKRNMIFRNNVKEAVAQCNFFGKTIFSESLHKISNLHELEERSSFIFRLKNKIIFSKKRNIIFNDNTRKISPQRCPTGKTIFSKRPEKENTLFRAAAILWHSGDAFGPRTPPFFGCQTRKLSATNKQWSPWLYTKHLMDMFPRFWIRWSSTFGKYSIFHPWQGFSANNFTSRNAILFIFSSPDRP